MVGLRRCVNNGTLDDPHKSKGMLTILSDPATLPHIALLVILSGSLYAAMSMDVFGSENQGAAIFVSLSLSYTVSYTHLTLPTTPYV